MTYVKYLQFGRYYASFALGLKVFFLEKLAFPSRSQVGEAEQYRQDT